MTKGALTPKGPGPKFLADAIERRGLSLSSIAEKCGVTRQHISFLCRGNTVPSLDLAVSLDELLGVPPALWVRNPDSAPVHTRLPEPSRRTRVRAGDSGRGKSARA